MEHIGMSADMKSQGQYGMRFCAVCLPIIIEHSVKGVGNHVVEPLRQKGHQGSIDTLREFSLQQSKCEPGHHPDRRVALPPVR
jgi:hypothetical protein